MKKNLYFLLVLLLSFSLVACGSSGDEKSLADVKIQAQTSGSTKYAVVNLDAVTVEDINTKELATFVTNNVQGKDLNYVTIFLKKSTSKGLHIIGGDINFITYGDVDKSGALNGSIYGTLMPKYDGNALIDYEYQPSTK